MTSSQMRWPRRLLAIVALAGHGAFVVLMGLSAVIGLSEVPQRRCILGISHHASFLIIVFLEGAALAGLVVATAVYLRSLRHFRWLVSAHWFAFGRKPSVDTQRATRGIQLCPTVFSSAPTTLVVATSSKT